METPDRCPSCLKDLPSSKARRRFCDQECAELFSNQDKPEPYYAMSHEQIGAQLGISKQAVERIEKRALSKLAKRVGSYI